jgi:hypothetical protein
VPGRLEGWTECLRAEQLRDLPKAPAPVARLVGQLVAPKAATRLAGLDGVQGALLDDGGVTEHGPALLPYLISLATAPRYPEAAALLVRLTGLMAALDEPPRSLAQGAGGAPERAIHDRLAERLPELLRVVRSSTSPEAARIAACLCARFPRADAELEPLLIALASGTSDADERARLLYALARVQASRRATFHRRVAEALQAGGASPEGVAVSLALAAHDPPAPLRGRVVSALERAREARRAFADPTAWGRTLSPARIERALAALGGA